MSSTPAAANGSASLTFAQQIQRDLRDLVGLDVDAELDAARVHPRLPVRDVPFHLVQVGQDQGCIQIFDAVTHADADRPSLLHAHISHPGLPRCITRAAARPGRPETATVLSRNCM
jgi:hypothetical protein